MVNIDTQVPLAEEKQESKAVLEIKLKLLEDGQVVLNVGEDKVSIDVIENMLKQSYDLIHEQKIIRKALEAFKSKLS